MNDVIDMQWSPEEYQQAAFLAREAGLEMLSRLDLMMIKPAVIVDAGCGAGELAAGLSQRYPDAKVYAVDLSEQMLSHAQQHSTIICRQEDAAKLSLPDHSVDLLCANFLLPWSADANACLREWRRVLSPNGLLMVSVLGTNTLREIAREALLPALVDMHDLGDALVAAGFADPVMDTFELNVRYRDAARMQHELRAAGFIPHAELPEMDMHVKFEVVHGHAFAPLASAEFKSDADGLVRIPVDHLRKSRG